MTESPFVLEGDQILREGEVRIFSIVWDDFVSVSSASTAAGVEAYINGSTDTGNLLASTVHTYSGNVQTLAALTVPAGSGGTAIIIEPSMASGSQTYKTAIVCRILKPGEE